MSACHASRGDKLGTAGDRGRARPTAFLPRLYLAAGVTGMPDMAGAAAARARATRARARAVETAREIPHCAVNSPHHRQE